jgi:hypothetical protein
MTELDMQQFMQVLFDEKMFFPLTGKSSPAKVETYKNAGVQTWDKGLLVTMDDGSRFLITISKEK